MGHQKRALCRESLDIMAPIFWVVGGLLIWRAVVMNRADEKKPPALVIVPAPTNGQDGYQARYVDPSTRTETVAQTILGDPDLLAAQAKWLGKINIQT